MDPPPLSATFLILNIVLLTSELIVVTILFHNTTRYVKRFAPKHDPYTLGTFILLGISTLVEISDLPWIILMLMSSPALK